MTPRPRKEADLSTYTGRFAERLRMLREKKKMTVEELAAVLKVQPIAVYKWEQGTRSPHISDLPAIAEVFKIKKVKDVLPEN